MFGCLDIWIFGFLDFLDFEIFRFLDFWMFGFLVFWLLEFWSLRFFDMYNVCLLFCVLFVCCAWLLVYIYDFSCFLEGSED